MAIWFFNKESRQTAEEQSKERDETSREKKTQFCFQGKHW